MLKQTSINNNAANVASGQDDKVKTVVSNLFKNAAFGLTNNEMVRDYDLYVNTMPATTAEEKTAISAIHQSLKGARTALTNSGILKLLGERVCSVSNNTVEYYAYVGIKLSKLDQLKGERHRRLLDQAKGNKKIAELDAKILKLEVKATP